MKRNFKLKALVLSVVVMMGLALLPKANAATIADVKFKNATGLTESAAASVVTFNVDKTELNPGDIVTLTVGTEKNPNGALQNFSFKVGWDSSKLDICTATSSNVLDENGTNIYFKAGEDVGRTLGLNDGRFGNVNTLVKTISGVSNVSYVNVAATAQSGFPSENTGTLFQLKFKVKATASGATDIFLLKEEAPYSGFDIVGAVKDLNGEYNTAERIWYTPKQRLSAYVKSNADNIRIPVNCNGISFEGISNLQLDKYSDRDRDISGYAKPTPSNTTDDMTWTSTNTNVAVVNNGVVTAVGKGNASIIVKCGNYTATLPVEVTAEPTGITFAQSRYSINYQETRDLRADITPVPTDSNYVPSKVTWRTSNASVATVDANGRVTGVSNGTATITATYPGYNGQEVRATTQVVVTVPLTSISLDKTDVTIYKGETAKVTVRANPNGAVWETLTPSFTSGSSFATVRSTDEGVEITGVAAGTAVVKVAANNGSSNDLTKTINVTVKENKVTGAIITNTPGAEVLKGQKYTMTGTYTTQENEQNVHASTDDTTMSWTSSRPEVAKISNKGVVTALKEGETTITLTVAGKVATYRLVVKEIHVEKIDISEEALKDLENIEGLTVGDVVTVPFTVLPSNTTDSVDEIIKKINLKYDKDLVDVSVAYDRATGKGVITLTFKKAGETKVDTYTGELPEDLTDVDPEDLNLYELVFNVAEPEVETPETGDMPVALLTVIMLASAAGVVVSRKIFVK